jgi:membrane-bound serine protease (ClpP class)
MPPSRPFPVGSRRPRAARAAGTAFLLAGIAMVFGGFPAARTADADAPAARYRSIRVIEFRDDIESALAAFTERRLEAAKAAGDDCIVLRIDSPGGTVYHSSEIADAVLALPKSIRTIAWVKEMAYSGAAMVALACDEIVMGPKAAVGDCQPILMSSEGIAPAGEKIETVLRAQFRKYAEDNGWPPLLAEKMVSKDMEVIRVRDERTGELLLADGAEFLSARDDDHVSGVPKEHLRRVGVVVGKDRLLTLTTKEAKEYGFVKRTFDDEASLLEALKADGAVVRIDEMTFSERAGRWLLGFAGILSAIVLLCAVLTIFRGVGLATFLGLGALVLLGLVTWTADLANGLALLLVGVGVLLLLAEAFLIPGFGFAGILGIVSTIAGFLFLTTGFTLESPGTLSWDSTREFLIQVVLTLAVGFGVVALLARLFPSVPFFNRMLLLEGDGLGAGAAIPVATWTPPAGATGVTATALRPAGRATLDGHGVDVTSEGGFVEAGTRVRVVRVEGARVVVRPEAPATTGRHA